MTSPQIHAKITKRKAKTTWEPVFPAQSRAYGASLLLKHLHKIVYTLVVGFNLKSY